MKRLVMLIAAAAASLASLTPAASANTTATISVATCDTSSGTVSLTGTIKPVPSTDFGIVLVSSVRGNFVHISVPAGFDITGAAVVGIPLPLGIIISTVFEDPNHNAVQDPGEQTIATARLVRPCEPHRKEECKKGGWQTFGFLGFENQGQCVNYVRRQARQDCIAERTTIGRQAFRAKYGTGRHHHQALRRCVKLATGT